MTTHPIYYLSRQPKTGILPAALTAYITDPDDASGKRGVNADGDWRVWIKGKMFIIGLNPNPVLFLIIHPLTRDIASTSTMTISDKRVVDVNDYWRVWVRTLNLVVYFFLNPKPQQKYLTPFSF